MEKDKRWLIVTTNPPLEILVYSEDLPEARQRVQDALDAQVDIVAVILQSALVDYIPFAIPEKIAVLQLSRN